MLLLLFFVAMCKAAKFQIHLSRQVKIMCILDSTIQWIMLLVVIYLNVYPLGSELSGGWAIHN